MCTFLGKKKNNESSQCFLDGSENYKPLLLKHTHLLSAFIISLSQSLIGAFVAVIGVISA